MNRLIPTIKVLAFVFALVGLMTLAAGIAYGQAIQKQIADYAKRRGQSVDATERWLRANLAYEPARC